MEVATLTTTAAPLTNPFVANVAARMEVTTSQKRRASPPPDPRRAGGDAKRIEVFNMAAGDSTEDDIAGGARPELRRKLAERRRAIDEQQQRHDAEMAAMRREVAKASADLEEISESARAEVAKERAASQQRIAQVVGAAGEALDRRAAETVEARANTERAKHLADLAFGQAKSLNEDNDELRDSVKILKELLQSKDQEVTTLTEVLKNDRNTAQAEVDRLQAIINNDRGTANTEFDKLRAVIADLTAKNEEGQKRLHSPSCRKRPRE